MPGSRPTDTGRRSPTPRSAGHPSTARPMWPLVMIVFAVLLIAFVVPASATEIINESLIDFTDTSKAGELKWLASGNDAYENLTGFYARDIALFDDISYFTLEVYGTQGYWPTGELIPDGRHETTYTYNGETKPAVIYISRNTNLVGQIISTRYVFFPQNWDRQGLGGGQSINTPLNLVDARGGARPYSAYTVGSTTTNLWLCNENGAARGLHLRETYSFSRISHATAISWVNNFRVTTTDDELNGYIVELIRTVNGISASSTIEIYQDTSIVYRNESLTDITLWYPQTAINKINVTSPIRTWSYDLNLETPGDPDDPDVASVAVYIQNSQTGALLANARLAILASAGGTEVEILNTTLPGGTGTYQLQPTGGGSPNPDYYRAVATVPGFSQIIENHSFTLNGPHDVIIEMRPDSGGPTDPERCYLEFYVRDIHANPISSASIQCDGRIKQTNSQGYAVFEVAKNATYPYVAKKSGYVTIEGTATVADGPRYVANVVLGPGTVPTYTPTLGPGETPGGPGATPTPDTRTNEQKGQAIIDLIADFAEPIAILAIVATVFGLMQMMMPRRR